MEKRSGAEDMRGGGEPLVILPGLVCDATLFGAQVAAFGAEVVTGFYGDADRIEAMAAYALDRLPPRPCALLGHSMGARVALEVCRRAPERVARLALANTGAHPVAGGEAAKRHALRDLGRAEGAGALADAWLPPMIGQARRGDAALMGRLREMVVGAGVEVFARQTEALLHRPDTADVFAAIACPTIVIAAADDAWAPVEQHRAIAAAIPGARLLILQEAGHMAPAEDPEGFNHIVRDWLTWPARDRETSHEGRMTA